MKKWIGIGAGLLAVGLGWGGWQHRAPEDEFPGAGPPAGTPLFVLSSTLSSLRLGELAPDLRLLTTDGREVSLAQFRNRRPVVLLFGSYTCDQFRQQQEGMRQLFARFRGVAEFFLVYIREAHPDDGVPVAANRREGISLAEPRSYAERLAVGLRARTALGLIFPCLVDGISNEVSRTYAAWPLRLVVVDRGGRIRVLSSVGPLAFGPALAEARQWLEALPQ